VAARHGIWLCAIVAVLVASAVVVGRLEREAERRFDERCEQLAALLDELGDSDFWEPVIWDPELPVVDLPREPGGISHCGGYVQTKRGGSLLQPRIEWTVRIDPPADSTSRTGAFRPRVDVTVTCARVHLSRAPNPRITIIDRGAPENALLIDPLKRALAEKNWPFVVEERNDPPR
jgi:hypothetical protein